MPNPDLRLARQFTILAYPFRHALAGHERAKRFEELKGRWVPWWGRLSRDDLECALDDTYFFLPYVRDLLFPETTLLSGTAPGQQLDEAAGIARQPAKLLAGRIPDDAVLRLTYDPKRLDSLRNLQLELARTGEQFSAPFDVHWIDVMLFPHRVGLLAAKIELKEDPLTVNRVNDLLYYIRLVHPPKLGWMLASWRNRNGDPRLTFQSSDLVDFLLQGLTERPTRHSATLEEFLDDLKRRPNTARYTATQLGQVYGQVFHLYTYICLAETPSPNGRDEPFVSPSERMLYELATTTDTSHPDYMPHPSHLARLLDRHHITLWSNWQALALSDNVVFLGVRAGRFTLQDLPHNVESDYFHLYAFTLFQKLWLSLAFGDLVRREVNLQKNLREARRLWDTFMSFQNRYWYSEVTRKPQGVELYQKFQLGLGVLPLYEEIREETGELQAYYERKFERRVASLLNFIAFVGLPAGLLAQLFSSALIQTAVWRDLLLAAAGTYAVVGGMWLIWRYASQRKER